jgi:hypothetical protein
MSQTKLVASDNGRVLGIHTWTDGYVPIQCPKKAQTEADVLATALWLEKRGMQEEALAYIERFFERTLQ